MNGLLFLMDVAGESLQRAMQTLQTEIGQLKSQVEQQRITAAELTSARVERDQLRAQLAQLQSGVAPSEVLETAEVTVNGRPKAPVRA